MATKKIKKVETPIDQRETFVSLQKNFADSEISVEEKLKTLYALQEADSAIDKIMQMRGELPSEVEALENEIADLKARQAQDAAVIEAYNQTIAENRQNMVDCDAQIDKYQQQLNDISNSREYDSINKEVENQGLLRQIAQKNINDTKAAGRALAARGEVTHCYERPEAPNFPYNLFAMVHARAAAEANAQFASLSAEVNRVVGAAVPAVMLLSTREYKKTSMTFFA